MPLKLQDGYLKGFVAQHEYEAMAPQVKNAHDMLAAGTGLGSDFLGWVTLPEDYDKDQGCRPAGKGEFRCVCGNRHWRVLPGRAGCY